MKTKYILTIIALILGTGGIFRPSFVFGVTVTPTASPSATPTSAEDEKIKEIRDAIKEKVSEIKEKIEKRAYVGVISQITDSTLTLENFRGKQRIRIVEETTLIGTNKKEIKIKDLAVGDKVIAMGSVSENEILEAKRVLVVLPPKTIPAKRLVLLGNISLVDSKKSQISVTEYKNLDKTMEIKIDSKVAPKFKDLKENQKVIVIYPSSAEGKIPLAKTLFLLP